MFATSDSLDIDAMNIMIADLQGILLSPFCNNFISPKDWLACVDSATSHGNLVCLYSLTVEK
jgi:hypothetical protein